MAPYAYTECSYNKIPDDSFIIQLCNDSTDASQEERRIDFLCILRALCLNYLEVNISGSATDLLTQIIKKLEEKNVIDDKEKQIIDTLKQKYNILYQLEHQKLLFWSQPTAYVDLRYCYDGIIESLDYLKNSSGHITIKTMSKGIDYSNLNTTHNNIKDSKVEIEKDEFDYPMKLILKLSSENPEDFYDGIKQWLELMINNSQKNGELISRFWSRKKPCDEDECTKFFSEHLRSSLYMLEDIFTIKTNKQCGNGRCDFLIEKGSVKIPIEAKTDEHSELWSAIKSQLIKKYLLDKDVYHGIYLVYWFKTPKQKKPPKKLKIANPNSAEELKALLHKHTVPNEYTDRISVYCIDCDCS